MARKREARIAVQILDASGLDAGDLGAQSDAAAPLADSAGSESLLQELAVGVRLLLSPGGQAEDVGSAAEEDAGPAAEETDSGSAFGAERTAELSAEDAARLHLHRLKECGAASDRVQSTWFQLLSNAVVAVCRESRTNGSDAPSGNATSEWVSSHLDEENLAVLAAVLDCSRTRAMSQAREAVTAVKGIPRFFEKSRAGAVAFGRVKYAAWAARSLSGPELEVLDDRLDRMRTDKTWKNFTRAVRDIIRTIRPPEDRLDEVHERRRVDLYCEDGQQGKLVLTGPVVPLTALHARLEATARAVRNRQSSAFGEQLPAGIEIDDERTLSQLMFDMLISSIPAGVVRTAGSPASAERAGSRAGQDGPVAGRPAAHASAGDGGAMGGAAGEGAVTGGTDADGAAENGEPVQSTAELSCPTEAEWLRRQASVVVTVPALTLTGHADLPGTFADGSPLHPELAAQFASRTSVYWRILTDPATGAVLDEVATSYRIPQAMRIALDRRRPWCTAPGCTRRAAACDKDHLEPFDHRAPESGGRTDMHNLHPLCRLHHQLKTRGILRLEHGPDGMIRWHLPYGVKYTDSPPHSPIDEVHAQLIMSARDEIPVDHAVTPATGPSLGGRVSSAPGAADPPAWNSAGGPDAPGGVGEPYSSGGVGGHGGAGASGGTCERAADPWSLKLPTADDPPPF